MNENLIENLLHVYVCVCVCKTMRFLETLLGT